MCWVDEVETTYRGRGEIHHKMWTFAKTWHITPHIIPPDLEMLWFSSLSQFCDAYETSAYTGFATLHNSLFLRAVPVLQCLQNIGLYWFCSVYQTLAWTSFATLHIFLVAPACPIFAMLPNISLSQLCSTWYVPGLYQFCSIYWLSACPTFAVLMLIRPILVLRTYKTSACPVLHTSAGIG